MSRLRPHRTFKAGPGRPERFKPRGFRQRLKPARGEGSLYEHDKEVRERLDRDAARDNLLETTEQAP